jgi:hypothetical protein
MQNQYGSIAMFLCIGVLLSFFTKNLTSILAAALVVTEAATRFQVIKTEGMTLEPTELKQSDDHEHEEEDTGIMGTVKKVVPSWLLGKPVAVKQTDDDDVDDENKMPSKDPSPDYDEKFKKEAMEIQEKERKKANPISFEGSNLIDGRIAQQTK